MDIEMFKENVITCEYRILFILEQGRKMSLVYDNIDE